MGNNYEMKKRSTVKSTFGLILIAAMVVVIVALVIMLLSNPEILEATMAFVAVIAGIVVALIVIAVAIYALSAIPYYALKGEEYQEGVDYSLDAVKEVEGNMIEKDDEE